MNFAAVAYPDPRRVTPEGHWERSAYDASLSAIRAAGYQGFEVARTRRLTTAVAAALRDHAAGQGLTAVALHAPSLHGRHVLRRQVAIAEAARALGAPLIVFHVSSLRFAHRDPTVRRRAWEGDRRLVRRLAAFLSTGGMTLALENGSHPDHPDYLLRLFDSLDLPNLGVALDIGHANLRAHVADSVAAKLGPWVMHTHLHDNHGLRDEHLPPGRGAIPWPRVAAALVGAKYTGSWCVELRPQSRHSLVENLREGRLFLERLLDP